MSSTLDDLIKRVKASTAKDTLVQKTFGKAKQTSESNRSIRKPKRPTTEGPDVVVFDGSALMRQTSLDSKAEKRAFMAGKILKTLPLEKKENITDREKEEEKQNLRHDQELKELLATSRLLEEDQKEAMTGKERRNHMAQKLEKLGVKSSPNKKVPLSIHLGMESKKEERTKRRIQKAKDMGMYDKSLRHLYVTKKTKERDRDPGITTGIGRMKKGMLTISKRDIERIENQGKASGAGLKKKRKHK